MNTHTGSQRIPFDETIFWDFTPNSAYLLGLIASDGYTRSWGFRIKLADRQLLQKIRDVLFPNHNILKENHEGDGRKNQHLLWVGSKKVASRLSELNIRSSIPPLKEELLSHYVRGFFDGDGTIYISKQGYLYVELFGSKELLGELEEKMRNALELRKRKVIEGNGGYKLTFAGSQLPLKLCRWLYDDAEIFLSRKYEVFQKFRKMQKRRKGKKFTKYTEEEIKFLEENYADISNQEISQILNRTKAAIRTKAHRLGLKKSAERRFRAAKEGWGKRRG